jgi:hypothetical protein
MQKRRCHLSKGNATTTARESYSRLQKLLGPVWVHVKSNGHYRVLCEAEVEATLEKVVVYKNISTNRIWTRPYAEFHDGRFVRKE